MAAEIPMQAEIWVEASEGTLVRAWRATWAPQFTLRAEGTLKEHWARCHSHGPCAAARHAFCTYFQERCMYRKKKHNGSSGGETTYFWVRGGQGPEMEAFVDGGAPASVR